MVAITASNISFSPGDPTTGDLITIECDFNVAPDVAHVQVATATDELFLTNGGLHGAATLGGWNIGEVFAEPILIIAVNDTDGILNKTICITVNLTTDKINQIRNAIFKALEEKTHANQPFAGFRIYKWDDPRKTRRSPYIEINLQPGQANEHLLGKDRIQFLNFSFDVVFKRTHRILIGEGKRTPLERDVLAQFYLGKLEEVLNDISWSNFDVTHKNFIGETHEEPDDIAQNYLFGAISTMLIGFKTK